jgi:hypothetical protein
LLVAESANSGFEASGIQAEEEEGEGMIFFHAP